MNQNFATNGAQQKFPVITQSPGQQSMMVPQQIEVQTANIGNEVLPVQQPILLQGGALPPLNVFHNPIWMTGQGRDDNGMYRGAPNQLSNGIPSSEQMKNLERLNQLNKQLDDELYKLKPVLSQNISIGGNSMMNQERFLQLNNNYEPSFPKLNGIDNSRFRESNFDFIGNSNNSSPTCIRREGMLKIRDVDQKDKEVVVTYTVLTKDRLTYFVNAKDESSIQGSIELGKIKESLKLINGFPTCFTIKTVDGVSDCSICAESEDSSREWINAITQNAVNCNTMSALNNLNKRGLLK
jgi:hypothetical protein